MRNKLCWLSILLLCFSIGHAVAQEDDGTADAEAFLTLNVRTNDQADIILNLSAPPPDWSPLLAALAATTGCPVSAFHHSAPVANSYVDRLPAARRQQVIQLQERIRLSDVQAHCASPFTSSGWSFSGHFNLQQLAAALNQAGVKSVAFTITHPDLPSEQHSPQHARASQFDAAIATYNFPTTAPDAVIDISYGFSRRALALTSGGLVFFLIFPVLLVLWMRAGALRLGQSDPMGAWFNYMRGLNLVTMIFGLLWIVGRLNPREELSQAILFRFGNGTWTDGVLSMVLWIVVPAFIYLSCLALSYPVYVRVRGVQWGRSHFYAAQAAVIGAAYLPVLFFCCGVVVLFREARLAVAFFIGAALARVVLRHWNLQLNGTFPQPLTTGELRDKVFAMAQSLNLQLKQVFVMPAGKANVANAFAARGGIVIFTDYLLQRLNKREVDAVVGHELTHLSRKHPATLQAALIGVFLLPLFAGTLLSIPLELLTAFLPQEWSIKVMQLFIHSGHGLAARSFDFVVVVLGMTGFYLLSRSFERVADRGATLLTRDPEAMITALLKIGQLNLIPLEWTRSSKTWASHPSSYDRVMRIAREANLPPGRMEQLLAAKPDPAEEHYQLPGVSDAKSAAIQKRFKWTQVRFWCLVIYHAVPACLVARFITEQKVTPGTALLEYLSGAALLLLAYVPFCSWIGTWGRSAAKPSSPGRLNVGFSPSPLVRFYTTSYDWDNGRVLLGRDRLVFVGELTKFAIPRIQFEDVWVGQGAPLWIPAPRVYFRWRTAAGAEKVYQFSVANSGKLWGRSHRAAQLSEKLRAWQAGSAATEVLTTEQTQLLEPAIGDVTNLTPQSLAQPKRYLNTILFPMLPAVLGVAILLRTGFLYPIAVMLALRVFELIPYRRFRDTPRQPVAKRAATASASQ